MSPYDSMTSFIISGHISMCCNMYSLSCTHNPKQARQKRAFLSQSVLCEVCVHLSSVLCVRVDCAGLLYSIRL